MHPPAAPHANATDPMTARLEALVADLVTCYERLVSLATSRLDAIRSSDARALALCVREENATVQRVAELERERGDVVSALAQRLGSSAQGSTRITWIARRLKGPEGERIGAMCETLRTLAAKLQSLNEVARQAAEQLATHMTGLLQAVARHLNHAKTYSRTGGVDAGPRVVSSLDIGA
ncbi:MAG: flagellar protein FlgN [Planctomycetota bacterium]